MSTTADTPAPAFTLPQGPWTSRCGAQYLPGVFNPAMVAEELLGLNWLTKRTARHAHLISI